MLKLTPKKRVLFVRRPASVLLVLFGVFCLVLANFGRSPQIAQAATANTINFQARLQTADGAIVPDGNYNVEFKLYSGDSCAPSTGTGCTALWTEDYLNSASKGLRTVNGYLSANLGSVTAFPGTINWSQKLWLSMNIGGTSTGSVTWDGAMLPYLSMTAVPYAFQAKSAEQLQTLQGSYTGTLQFDTLTNNETFVIQDQGAAGTYNLLTENDANANYIQNQNTGAQATSNFWISGTGIADKLQASGFDTAAAGTLTIGGTNATTVNIASNNVAHTINIGAGTGIQNVTIGSLDSTSTTTIQGGNGGIIFSTNPGSGSYVFRQNGSATLTLDYAGRLTLQSPDDTDRAFAVINHSGSYDLVVDTDTGFTTLQGLILPTGGQGIVNYSTLSFQGTTTTDYVTPLGTSVATKISVQNYNPGAYNQILALGLPTTADANSRVITLLDGRTGFHQPTITVISPDEQQTLGLSWEGATNTTGGNGTPSLVTSASIIGLNAGGTAVATFDATSGASITGSVNATAGYSVNGTAGLSSLDCSGSGKFLQNPVVAGGIVTGGSCVSAATGLSGSGDAGYIAMFSGSGTNMGSSIISQTGTSSINIDGDLTSAGTLTVSGAGDSSFAGNLGIGTTSPGYALDVQGGDINTSGYYYQGGQMIINTLTGENNAFFGVSAGNTTTTGYHNTGVGYGALQADTTGYYNTAVGYGSLQANTTGMRNTALGSGALITNTTGNYNTAVGHSALRNNTTGESNTAVGRHALREITTGSNDIALGMDAGHYIQGGVTLNQTSGNSIYIGNDTRALADGDTNEIVIGHNTTGNGSNTVTLGNTNIVTTVLQGDVGIGTSSPNYSLDVQGGDINTSGYYYQGGKLIVDTLTGTDNTFIGANAGDTSTTGAGNVAVGSHAFSSSTTGQYSTALGYQSLQYNTTGGGNTATGAYSLKGITTGTHNTGLGYAAGAFIQDGVTYNQTSSNSTFVGYGSKAQADGDTNETVIGYQATGNGSNTVTLGNSSVTATYLQGTVDASSGFSVDGAAGTDITCTGGQFLQNQVVSGGIVTGGSCASAATGLSGSGTNGKIAMFSGGSTQLGDSIMSQSGTTVMVGGDLQATGLDTTTAGSGILSIGGANAGSITLGADTSLGSGKTFTANGSGFDGNGNLGVGTTSPNYALDVQNGDINMAHYQGGYRFAGDYILRPISNGVLVGVGAGPDAMPSGSDNIAIGNQSLHYLTSGYQNTAIGTSALGGLFTGYSNTAVGYQALQNTVANVGDTALGYNAGVQTDGINYATSIGYDALVSASSTSTAIGAYSKVTASNSLVLGCKSGTNGCTTSTKVGIGTTAPGYTLDVQGGDINTSGVYRVGGTSGSTVSCTGGNVLQNQVVQGGIITGGTCVANGGGVAPTLQDVYNNSSNPATIVLTSTNHGVSIQDASSSVGGTLFAIQSNGGATNYLAVTSSGASVTGTLTVSTAIQAPSLDNPSSTLTLGASASSIVFGSGGNTITFTSSGGLVAAGSARHVKILTFNPEYAGAVLDATQDSACYPNNVNGTMTSGFDGVKSYYQWTATQSTAQCYDVVLQVPVPSDIDAWDADTTGYAVNVDGWTSSTSNGTISMQTLNGSGTVLKTWQNATPSSASAWATTGVGSNVGSQLTPGDFFTLQLRVSAANSAQVRLGAIHIYYYSKF